MMMIFLNSDVKAAGFDYVFGRSETIGNAADGEHH